MSNAKQSILAWHFLPENGRLAYTNRPVKVGGANTVKPPIVPCQRGLHASVRAIDALEYAPGPVVCRVECSGEIVPHGGDKLACSRRKVLAMADATTLLHEFACWCAEQALARAQDPAPRSVAAIAAKRAWLRGEIGDRELAAAREAAWAAAGEAAREAAWEAAGEAAREAAWEAAGAAARAAARETAWVAARVAAREAQNAELEARLFALLSLPAPAREATDHGRP